MGISACLRFDTIDKSAKKTEQSIYVRDKVSLHEILNYSINSNQKWHFGCNKIDSRKFGA